MFYTTKMKINIIITKKIVAEIGCESYNFSMRKGSLIQKAVVVTIEAPIDWYSATRSENRIYIDVDSAKKMIMKFKA